MVLPSVPNELAPTDYARRMRPLFIGMIVAIMGVVLGKFVISDVWGAVSLVFVCLMGILVISGHQGVNAANALFYCVMAIISGTFDVISCFLYFQHSKYRPFDHKAPAIVIFAQLIFITSPIVLFASALLSYSIFTDCRDHNQDILLGIGSGVNYAPLATIEDHLQHEQAPRQNQAFVPFMGRPQRLGDD